MQKLDVDRAESELFVDPDVAESYRLPGAGHLGVIGRTTSTTTGFMGPWEQPKEFRRLGCSDQAHEVATEWCYECNVPVGLANEAHATHKRTELSDFALHWHSQLRPWAQRVAGEESAVLSELDDDKNRVMKEAGHKRDSIQQFVAEVIQWQSQAMREVDRIERGQLEEIAQAKERFQKFMKIANQLSSGVTLSPSIPTSVGPERDTWCAEVVEAARQVNELDQQLHNHVKNKVLEGTASGGVGAVKPVPFCTMDSKALSKHTIGVRSALGQCRFQHEDERLLLVAAARDAEKANKAQTSSASSNNGVKMNGQKKPRRKSVHHVGDDQPQELRVNVSAPFTTPLERRGSYYGGSSRFSLRPPFCMSLSEEDLKETDWLRDAVYREDAMIAEEHSSSPLDRLKTYIMMEQLIPLDSHIVTVNDVVSVLITVCLFIFSTYYMCVDIQEDPKTWVWVVIAVSHVLSLISLFVRFCTEMRGHADFEIINNPAEAHDERLASVWFWSEVVAAIPWAFVFGWWAWPVFYVAVFLQVLLRIFGVTYQVHERKPLQRHRRIHQPLVLCAMVVCTTHLSTVVMMAIEPDLAYHDSIHMLVATLTSVGYGDIIPETRGGKAFTDVVMVIGIVGTAALTAYGTTFMQSIQVRKSHIEEKKAVMSSMMNYYKVPKRVQHQVAKDLLPAMIGNAVDGDFLRLSSGDNDLSRTLAMYIRRHSLKHMMPTGTPEDCINDLLSVAKDREVAAGDLICEVGDPDVEHMFMVLDGLFEARRPGQPTRYLSRGSYFGHQGMLTGNPRHSTVRCVVDGVLLTLGRTDFDALNVRHHAALNFIANDVERIRFLRHNSDCTGDLLASVTTPLAPGWSHSRRRTTASPSSGTFPSATAGSTSPNNPFQ